jgi:hypothetical protein
MLRLSIGRYKRIRLDPLATILIEAFVEACERRGVSIKRHPQGRAFSLYLKNVSRAQSLIERTIYKRDCHVFRFSQSLVGPCQCQNADWNPFAQHRNVPVVVEPAQANNAAP